ncbi:MAG: AbrB family transcriptional regulator [Pseudomonadota bacterium]
MTTDEPQPSRMQPPANQRRTFWQITRDRLPGITLAFAVGTIGALVFIRLKAPLPIFLGSLAFCMAASIFRVPLKRPKSLSGPMRAVLGVAIGAAFTPELLQRAPELAVSLALIVPFSAAITYAGYLFYSRVASFSRATAFFGSVPGGLNDMVAMAESAGADQRAVTLLSSVRMVAILFLIPIWMQATTNLDVGGAIINTIHVWEMRTVDIVVIVVIAAVGWWAADRLGIAGAAIVGPMIVSAFAHAFGLTAALVPTEALILAQLTLGILLGAQFRGVTMRELSTTVLWGVLFSAVIMVATLAVAYGVWTLTGADPNSVLLAYAPGGQSELNLLALILQLDVAFIALHHLLRVAAVIIGAQIVFRLHPSWQVGSVSAAPASPHGQRE